MSKTGGKIKFTADIKLVELYPGRLHFMSLNMRQNLLERYLLLSEHKTILKMYFQLAENM